MIQTAQLNVEKRDDARKGMMFARQAKDAIFPFLKTWKAFLKKATTTEK